MDEVPTHCGHLLEHRLMKSLRKTSPAHGLQLQETERAAPREGEVLIRVKATGVCGTDLHIDEWTPSYHFMAPALPVTIGHEFSGEVAELGAGLSGLHIGQRVTVRPSVVCGVCPACAAGQPDACVTRRGIGVMRDGAFAEWVRVPARNCVAVPQSLDPLVAALAEPLSVSWEAVRTAGVQAGEMPPKSADQPTAAERTQAVATLAKALTAAGSRSAAIAFTRFTARPPQN